MIIDFHTHIVPPDIIKKRDVLAQQDTCLSALYGDPKAKMATVEDLINSMDQDGIDFSVMVNMGWASLDLCQITNDYIMQSVKQYPDRLAGFGMIDPRWKNCVKEIERCANGGLIGIGELMPHLQGYDLGDENLMKPVVESTIAHNMIIMTHSSEPVGHLYSGKGNVHPQMLYRFITNFPEQKVICAHWGGGLPFYALMPEVLTSFGNVWFDTAASPFLYSYDIFNIVTQITGDNRILFGSDFPLITQKRIVNALERNKEIDIISRSRILGENAGELMGMF